MRRVITLLLLAILPACGSTAKSPAASAITAAPTNAEPSLAAYSITAPTAAITTATPTVTWGASTPTPSTASVAYNVSVSAKSDCSSPSQTYTAVTTTEQALTALTAGSYYVCVNATSGSTTLAATNSPFAFTVTLTTPAPTLAAFSITAPATSTTTATPTVTWAASTPTPSTASVTYSVSISANSDCSSPSQSYTAVTAVQQVLTTLTAGSYYACVTATSGSATTTASNSPYAFTVTLPPGSFSVTSVSSGTAVLTIQTPTLTWGTANGAGSYSVTVSSNSDCSSPSQTYSTTSVTQLLTTLTQGTYYACVSAVDAAGSTVATNNDYKFTVTYPTLPSGYTIRNGTGVSKPGTFTNDMATGIPFTCTISGTTYNQYKFATAVVTNLGGNSMEVDSPTYYTTTWVGTYHCAAY